MNFVTFSYTNLNGNKEHMENYFFKISGMNFPDKKSYIISSHTYLPVDEDDIKINDEKINYHIHSNWNDLIIMKDNDCINVK